MSQTIARGRSTRRASWAVGVVLLVACAPTPSNEPLGWGPLAPGMQAATPQRAASHPNKESHRPSSETPATAATATKAPEPEQEAASATSKPAVPEPAAGADAKAKAPPSASAFVGDYRGEDVAVYRIESMPDRTEKDPNARMKVTSTSDTELAFELVDSSNGNEICTLTGTLGEAGVTIAKGQKCFEQNAEEASASATVQSGTATMAEARLLFDLDMSFSMEIGDKKLGGSLSYHFDGKRK